MRRSPLREAHPDAPRPERSPLDARAARMRPARRSVGAAEARSFPSWIRSSGRPRERLSVHDRPVGEPNALEQVPLGEPLERALDLGAVAWSPRKPPRDDSRKGID